MITMSFKFPIIIRLYYNYKLIDSYTIIHCRTSSVPYLRPFVSSKPFSSHSLDKYSSSKLSSPVHYSNKESKNNA